MKSLLKKTILLGMGAISITKEKAEAVTRELIEKGEVTKEEAKDFVDQLMEKGKEEQKAFKDSVRRELEDFKDSMGLVTKNDIIELNERLTRIEESMKANNAESIKE